MTLIPDKWGVDFNPFKIANYNYLLILLVAMLEWVVIITEKKLCHGRMWSGQPQFRNTFASVAYWENLTIT